MEARIDVGRHLLHKQNIQNKAMQRNTPQAEHTEKEKKENKLRSKAAHKESTKNIINDVCSDISRPWHVAKN